jgi:hypothetical protein
MRMVNCLLILTPLSLQTCAFNYIVPILTNMIISHFFFLFLLLHAKLAYHQIQTLSKL